MLDYIKGILVESSIQKVTLENQGLGYRLLIPFNHYAKLPPLGSDLILFIATVIREDAHKAYGFIDKEQRDLFESLIDVSGIGPKIALALLGHMEMGALYFAIANGKTETICKIPGVGKKTAERLVIEMRDKIKKLHEASSSHAAYPLPEQTLLADAISAMIHLGYNESSAQKAIKIAFAQEGAPKDLAHLITEALRLI